MDKMMICILKKNIYSELDNMVHNKRNDELFIQYIDGLIEFCERSTTDEHLTNIELLTQLKNNYLLKYNYNDFQIELTQKPITHIIGKINHVIILNYILDFFIS